jgi:glucose-6-phosphate-specific signal transduction histidine kinase
MLSPELGIIRSILELACILQRGPCIYLFNNSSETRWEQVSNSYSHHSLQFRPPHLILIYSLFYSFFTHQLA